MISAMDDAVLVQLAKRRRELIRHYAHLLSRFGPSHKDRSKLNADRTKKRKIVRRSLQINANDIVNHVMRITE